MFKWQCGEVESVWGTLKCTRVESPNFLLRHLSRQNSRYNILIVHLDGRRCAIEERDLRSIVMLDLGVSAASS